MNTTKGKILFKTIGESRVDEVMLGETKITIATHMTENQRSVRVTDGIVVCSGYSKELKVGDKVYFSRNTVDDYHRVDLVEHIYWCDEQYLILAERDGEIIPLNNYLLANKVDQTVEKIGSLYVPDCIKEKAKRYNICEIKFGPLKGGIYYYSKVIRDGLTININGVDYLYFNMKFLLADLVCPREGYVSVRLIEAKKGTIITMTEEREVYAIIESVGKNSIFDIGDKVLFYRRAIGTEMSNGAYLMREDTIEFKIN